MKTLLKLEELAMLAFCILVLWLFHAEWWVYLALLIAPDISMLGYLVNNKVGAWSYNLFHHKGVAILFFILGFLFLDNNIGIYFHAIGIAMFGHSSMDRFFGFGLKTTEGFKFTHLGKLGEN